VNEAKKQALPSVWKKLFPRDWPEVAAVAMSWLAMVGLVVFWIAQFGSDIPRADDWSVVNHLALEEPLTLSWLWAPLAEHRMPLQKLVMWATWNATEGSLRAGMLCGFLPLAIVASLLPFIARSVRGRMEYTDTFFPLALLSLAHAGVFLWFTTIAVSWTVALTCLLTASLLKPHWYEKATWIVGLGICLLLLAMQGAPGLVASVPLGFGFLAIAFFQWRDAEKGCFRKTWILAGFALAPILLLLIYVATFPRNRVQGGGQFDAIRIVVTAIEYLTMSLGTAGKRLWPLSGAVIVAIILVSSGLLVFAWRRGNRCRRRMTIAMGSALAAPVAVSLAVGVGRQFQGALLDRYSLYATPLLCCIYLIWATFPPKRLGRFVQMCLFVLVCAPSLFYMSEALRLGKDRRERTDAFHADIGDCVPLAAIVARHGPYWGLNEESFRSGLELLQQAEIEPFVNIAADPPMREMSLDLKPERIEGMTQDDGVWEAKGRDSQLVFRLPDVEHVYAVRLEYTLQCKRGSTVFRVAWERAGVEDPFRKTEAKEILVNFNTAKERRPETQTVWIDEDVRQLAISPGAEPCSFDLHRITLLVPPADGP